MEKLSKESFLKLANDIMFDLNEQEIDELTDEFDTLMQQMQLLDNIDTSSVAEMVYPFEEETTYMREDEIENILTQEETLLNARNSKDGLLVVPKVVK